MLQSDADALHADDVVQPEVAAAVAGIQAHDAVHALRAVDVFEDLHVGAFQHRAANALAVRILKADNPGSTKDKEGRTWNGGALGYDNPTFHASVGWDWISTIRGRNTGIWNDVTLDGFLQSPTTYVHGTRMGYAGVKDDQERADLIAYLKAATRP